MAKINDLASTAIFPIIAAIFRPNRIPKGGLARPDIPGDLSGERPSKSDARGRGTRRSMSGACCSRYFSPYFVLMQERVNALA
jgi:hypothetical protein